MLRKNYLREILNEKAFAEKISWWHCTQCDAKHLPYRLRSKCHAFYIKNYEDIPVTGLRIAELEYLWDAVVITCVRCYSFLHESNRRELQVLRELYEKDPTFKVYCDGMDCGEKY